MGSLDVVVGAQFGSEAKGHVTQQVVRRRIEDGSSVLNVRVAGPNAGHTVVVGQRAWPMRQVPVGFSAVPTDVASPALAIAAGSEIDLEVLVREIGELRQAGLLERGQLYVDPEATLIEPWHKDVENGGVIVGHWTEQAEPTTDLVKAIGSTGKGVGAARAARLMRQARRLVDEPNAVRQLRQLGVEVSNTQELISEYLRARSGVVVIEGTQGFGLGLHAGAYPYATSSNCRAIDFLAMAGVPPWVAADLRVWLTMRPFPIRVAGDSGPLRHETTWSALGLPEEKTTVTQKVRRVGLWDPRLVKSAVQANGGGKGGVVYGAMTMLDQVFPGMRGLSSWSEIPAGLGVAQWLADREQEIGCLFGMVTTGPDTGIWL